MTRTNKPGFKARVTIGTLGVAGILGAAIAMAAPDAVPVPLPAVAPPPQWSVTLPPGTYSGYSKPSNQSDLAFPIPGVVSTIYLKLGDPVKKDQIIAQQDDSEEKARLLQATAELNTAALQVLAAQADFEKKVVDLSRVEKVYKEKVAAGETNSEIDTARVDVKIAKISIDYRKGELEQKKAQVVAQQVRVEQKKLKSPLTGVVSKMDLHAGEGTDIQRPTGIQVVQNDPVWVDVNIPSAQTAQLRKGQTLTVQYVDGGDWTPAQIIVLSDVADPRANSRLVRLQMANPIRKDGTRRESGLQVLVKLPDNLVTNPAAAGVPPAAAAPGGGR